jgi:hypothetical protein
MRGRIIKLILVISLLAIVAVLFIALTSSSKSSNEALKICFQSYSNSPSGQRFALFAVTNLDTCNLILWNGGSVEFEGTNSPWNMDVFYSLVGSNLQRGVSYTMFTGVPSNHPRWRLTWMVHRSSFKQALVDISGRIPFVPDYNNSCPDFFYYTTDWIPESNYVRTANSDW